jgi:hypothetical protein
VHLLQQVVETLLSPCIVQNPCRQYSYSLPQLILPQLVLPCVLLCTFCTADPLKAVQVRREDGEAVRQLQQQPGAGQWGRRGSALALDLSFYQK